MSYFFIFFRYKRLPINKIPKCFYKDYLKDKKGYMDAKKRSIRHAPLVKIKKDKKG